MFLFEPFLCFNDFYFVVGAYRSNRRLRNIVSRVMVIGYLPVLVVRQNFIMLRNSRRGQHLVRFPELDDWLELGVRPNYAHGRQFTISTTCVECIQSRFQHTYQQSC